MNDSIKKNYEKEQIVLLKKFDDEIFALTQKYQTIGLDPGLTIFGLIGMGKLEACWHYDEYSHMLDNLTGFIKENLKEMFDDIRDNYNKNGDKEES